MDTLLVARPRQIHGRGEATKAVLAIVNSGITKPQEIASRWIAIDDLIETPDLLRKRAQQVSTILHKHKQDDGIGEVDQFVHEQGSVLEALRAREDACRKALAFAEQRTRDYLAEQNLVDQKFKKGL